MTSLLFQIDSRFNFLKTSMLMIQNNNLSFASKLYKVGMCGPKDTNDMFCLLVSSVAIIKQTKPLYSTQIPRIFVRRLAFWQLPILPIILNVSYLSFHHWAGMIPVALWKHTLIFILRRAGWMWLAQWLAVGHEERNSETRSEKHLPEFSQQMRN